MKFYHSVAKSKNNPRFLRIRLTRLRPRLRRTLRGRKGRARKPRPVHKRVARRREHIAGRVANNWDFPGPNAFQGRGRFPIALPRMMNPHENCPRMIAMMRRAMRLLCSTRATSLGCYLWKPIQTQPKRTGDVIATPCVPSLVIQPLRYFSNMPRTL